MNENRSGLCTAGMVLGIIGVVTSIIFNLGFIPCLLGLIFSIICLAKKKQPKGRAVAGLVTSIIGLILGFIAMIIGVIFLLTSGIILGALGLGVKEGMDAYNSIEDKEQLINVINNLEDSGFDYNSLINSPEYNEFINNYSEGGEIDINSLLNDLNSTTGGSTAYDFVLGTTAFEDLTKYGYTYLEGNDQYQIYKKDGAEYEFPAYVYDYTSYGNTQYDAYMNYITDAGFTNNDFSFYDKELFTYNDEWSYAVADQIGSYYDDYGEWNPYELFLLAFNEKTNDMVILIYRIESDEFDADKTGYYISDLEQLMNYMTHTTSY